MIWSTQHDIVYHLLFMTRGTESDGICTTRVGDVLHWGEREIGCIIRTRGPGTRTPKNKLNVRYTCVWIFNTTQNKIVELRNNVSKAKS